ncbi:MAG TPA: PEGA domain-containing protein [Candidatus Acidoferrales bacterium]|nr:PEGA domain-containing protein [Candidatus Acidoferrales bacterium]
MIVLRALLAGFVAAIFATTSVARADTKGGAIYLTTLPSGADTWVDGAYVGHTPVLVDALGLGKHTITAAKTGWESRELHVTVRDQDPMQFVDMQLDRDPSAAALNGTLALHAGLPIRSVTVDGTPVKLSSAGKLDMAPGQHMIAVETQSGRFERQVDIYPDTTTNVVVRIGSDNANHAIVVAPATNYLPVTDVTVDGKRIAIRHNGHTVSGMLGDATMRIDGEPATFDTPPAMIGGKLFLPLDLFVRIGAVPLRPH